MGNLSKRWQQAQAKAMERDLLPGWYATRGRRRMLAAAGMVAVGLMWVDAAVSWSIGPSDNATRISLILLAVMFVIYMPTVTLLNIATRGVNELAERQLDERQTGERLRAIALAHRIMLGILVVLVAVALAAGLARGGPGSSVPTTMVVQLSIALMLTHFVLPLIIAAWRLPDLPPDDE
ncbi:hypothetical protein AB0M44_14235 [Streptosporangium subroseum]|uniref:hypothetical protein n=1 Tax=Streptosporangium subroseum TaxID=106412 RepID=UPI0034268BF2